MIFIGLLPFFTLTRKIAMHSMTISVKISYKIIFLNLTSRSTDDKHQDLSSVSKLKGYDADLPF